VRKLLMHAPLAVADARWTDPHTKANALLQAHFSRSPLPGDLAADQKTVVLQAVRLLQARALGSDFELQINLRCNKILVGGFQSK
jgi:hypothetical protein